MRSDDRQSNEERLVSCLPEDIFQFTRLFSNDFVSSNTFNHHGLLYFVTQTQINAIRTESNGHGQCNQVFQSQQLYICKQKFNECYRTVCFTDPERNWDQFIDYYFFS